MASGKVQKPIDTRRLKAVLKRAPESIQHMVAERAAPKLTRGLQAFHASKVGVDGVPYPVSRVTGKQVTLSRSRKNESYLYFEADGSRLTARLRTSYAPYLVGKYGILPRGQQYLPSRFIKIVDAEIAKLQEQGFGLGGV